MREHELLEAGAFGHASKKLLPRTTRAIFIPRNRARLNGTWQTVPCRKLPHKLGIPIAVRAAQLVIEMTDVRLPADFDKDTEQGNGIRAT